MAAAIPLAMMAGSTLLNMSAQRKQAQADERASQLEAAQMDRQAQVDRAMSQRGALEERRQARIAQSALQARAGGGGPDIERMSGDIAAEGEYRALSALYAGETGARSAEFSASERRRRGADAASASRIGQISTLLSTGSKMYSNFGGGGIGGGGAGGFSAGSYDSKPIDTYVRGSA